VLPYERTTSLAIPAVVVGSTGVITYEFFTIRLLAQADAAQQWIDDSLIRTCLFSESLQNQ
jgi:hypothetical protein